MHRNQRSFVMMSFSSRMQHLMSLTLKQTGIRYFRASTANKANILCMDNIDEICGNILRRAGHTVDSYINLEATELRRVIPKYDGIIVQSETVLTKDIIEAGENLKIIGRAGTNVDNINITAASRRGISVMNTPGARVISLAELTLSLILALAKKIPAANESLKSNKWERRSRFTGIELDGKTLGIIGLDKVGFEVAKRAIGLGMNVLAYDPLVANDAAAVCGIEKIGLRDVFSSSDFLSCHTPLTKTTRRLLNKDSLRICKKGVNIVNVYHTEILDENDVFDALESGRIGGIALNASNNNNKNNNNNSTFMDKLNQHPSCINTHNLDKTADDTEKKNAATIGKQFVDVFQHQEYAGIVNAPYLMVAYRTDIMPYARVAEYIGSLQAQLAPTRRSIGSVKVYITGEDRYLEGDMLQSLMKSAVLKGLLPHFYDQREGSESPPLSKALSSSLSLSSKQVVNLVNAPLLSLDVGLITSSTAISNNNKDNNNNNISVNDSIMKMYRNTIIVEVGNGEVGDRDYYRRRIIGTVMNGHPRIVQIDDWNSFTSFSPNNNNNNVGVASNMLFFNNLDRPGAVNSVLEVLHRHKVNVASLGVGRNQDTTAASVNSVSFTSDTSTSRNNYNALAMLTVDEPLTNEVLKEISDMEFLENVKLVSFS